MGTFGDNLRAAMAARGMTNAALATALSVTPPQIDKWLNSSNVELATLFRVAKALRCSIESLIEHVDPDYDAMMIADRHDEARITELFQRVARRDPLLAEDWLRMLARMAQAPVPPDAPPDIPSGGGSFSGPRLAMT